MPSIIIFDGTCNLCNGLVDFLIKRDPQDRFVYVANQSEAGQMLLSQLGEDASDVQTFFVYAQGKLYKRSRAALAVAASMPFPWRLGLIGWIVPRPLADAIYRWVARNRYRWFGKKDSCRMPTEAERQKLLDRFEDVQPLIVG